MKTFTDPYKCYFCDVKDTVTLKSTNNKNFRKLVEVHHIEEKNMGGTNEMSNLVPVCSNHHSMIHQNLIKIDKWYSSTKGMILKWTDENGNEHWGN